MLVQHIGSRVEEGALNSQNILLPRVGCILQGSLLRKKSDPLESSLSKARDSPIKNGRDFKRQQKQQGSVLCLGLL